MPALQPASHRPRPGAGAVTPTEGRARPAAVLLTTTFPARSGDGTPEFVLTLARSLRAFDVTVVAPRMKGSSPDEVVDGVRIRRFAYFPERWEGLASDAIMPTLRAQPWRIVEVPCLIGGLFLAARREIKRQRAVVINPHWIVPAGMVSVVLSRLCRVPYVVTIHGADAYTLRGRVSSLVKRIVLGRAHEVLPVSGDIARTLELKADVPVLRMGVDTAVVRKAIGRREPEPGLLVAIGRLADKKGIDVLLNALVDVPGARLEVVGDGPDRGALEVQSERLGLSDRVTFLGRQPRDGVLDALRRATAVAIPSVVGAGGDMEGTPVVLCEAMAAGVPVVASALGGLEECLVDGKTGLLVPPGDVESLGQALNRVVSGEVDLEAMGQAAADEAQRTLDITTIGGVYDRVMTEAAEAAGTLQPQGARS